ncbi:uncharacterized protein DNG_08314 [Cephalotrichum gorgonifer]|uniref:Peroxisomal membrane protein PEX14 n=1 Tax=Cephalotrichum gorgonifer TaxID=2041049 RepID=A0AAE8SZ06_9PEZI|nr:uncharacterized protein DNG_08314 [Cephalotrichum gorgonifer]
MSNPDEERPDKPQDEATAAESDVGPSPTSDTESRLDIAKRFLENEAVRDASREKKVEFLRSKDLTDEEIESLLGSEIPSPPQTTQPSEPQQQHQHQHQELANRAPIITYPEFLAEPADPPLLSPNTLLNAFYALTGLTTLLYGTKRYYVDPSLAAQTSAREDLASTTTSQLTSLISKLESAVSSVPTSSSDDASSCGDPTELFSRDVGTQTSPLPTPVLKTIDGQPPTTSQTAQLATLCRNLSDLKEGLDAQAENTQDAMAVADGIREHLREASVATSYVSLGWRQSEPDDEVKKVKENIRRLKGVFLSTRNFPVSTK